MSTQAGFLLGRKARQNKCESKAERGLHTWSDYCVQCAVESGDSIHGLLICCDGHACSNAFCLDCSGGPLAPRDDEPFYCTTCLAKDNDDAARLGSQSGDGAQNAPRIRRTPHAWFHFVYSAPTMQISSLRLDEFLAALPRLSPKWMANLRATLKLYADATRCDKFTMEHTTNSIAEGMNRIVKKDGPLNKYPAQAIPGKIADVLSRIEDRRESRAGSARSPTLHRDDEFVKQSRELAGILATTTSKEH